MLFLPRLARQKNYDAIFHIMSRSITEVDLFKDTEDKLMYLSKIQKYQNLYKFKIYGYCLMDNHVHLIIDANGADISKVMHSINFSYALYFNKKHKRHGHLFQDRFKSKMILDERYLLTLSAYIHNNPRDIKDYETCPEKYEFSSLSIYMKLRQDPYELVEDGFIKGLFGKNSKVARENYIKFVYKCKDKEFKDEIEFTNEGTEYRSGRKILVRNFIPQDAIDFIANKLGIPRISLCLKGSKNLVEAKALIVVIMRSLCNLKCVDICNALGNITQMRVSNLSSIGIKLIYDGKYGDFMQEFISSHAM